MPFSSSLFDDHICNWVRSNIQKNQLILDVGVGAGKFAQILPDYAMDGVEYWEPYVAEYKLASMYKVLWIMTIQTFIKERGLKGYGCILMGDCLEHLSIEDAQFVVQSFLDSEIPAVIKVPFLYHQIVSAGDIEAYPVIAGNDLENHLQPDLTHPVMMERYEGLTPLITNDVFGVYIAQR